MDIIDKIDAFLNEIKIKGKYEFIEQKTVLTIIDKIIEEMKDDKILLETIKLSIEKEWKRSNIKLLEKFYKILAYYGILDDNKITRKTIMETKGKTIIRKFVTLKNKQNIKNLL